MLCILFSFCTLNFVFESYDNYAYYVDWISLHTLFKVIMGIIIILFIMVLCRALKCRRSTTAASIETDSDHDKSKEDESGNAESETVTPVWHRERNLYRASTSFCNTNLVSVSCMYLICMIL